MLCHVVYTVWYVALAVLPQLAINMVCPTAARSQVIKSKSTVQEATVRAMRNFFNPIVGETPEVTESWQSEPNPGLADSKTVTVYTGTTLGGSSAINGAQFSIPVNEVRSARADSCSSMIHAPAARLRRMCHSCHQRVSMRLLGLWCHQMPSQKESEHPWAFLALGHSAVCSRLHSMLTC